MTGAYFLDTTYLLALLIPRDALHSRASDWREKLRRHSTLTTEYVLLEVLDALARRDARQAGLSVWDSVGADPLVTVIHSSPELMKQGLDLYRQRSDQDWQLTDCISFVVMQQHRIRDALTYDHHFEQAGFRALLRHEVDDLD